MIHTTSKRPRGHISAGVFHHPKGAGGSRFGDQEFSEAQLAELKADPELIVERTAEPLPGAAENPTPGPSPLAGKEGADDDELSAQWEEIGEAQADLTQREERLAERAEALGKGETALREDQDAWAERVKTLGDLQSRVKDPDFREAIARAAVARVMKAGNADDLTKDGKPKTEAVEAEFPGLEISAGERDRFFEELEAPEQE